MGNTEFFIELRVCFIINFVKRNFKICILYLFICIGTLQCVSDDVFAMHINLYLSMSKYNLLVTLFAYLLPLNYLDDIINLEVFFIYRIEYYYCDVQSLRISYCYTPVFNIINIHECTIHILESENTYIDAK